MSPFEGEKAISWNWRSQTLENARGGLVQQSQNPPSYFATTWLSLRFAKSRQAFAWAQPVLRSNRFQRFARCCELSPSKGGDWISHLPPYPHVTPDAAAIRGLLRRFAVRMVAKLMPTKCREMPGMRVKLPLDIRATILPAPSAERSKCAKRQNQIPQWKAIQNLNWSGGQLAIKCRQECMHGWHAVEFCHKKTKDTHFIRVFDL